MCTKGLVGWPVYHFQFELEHSIWGAKEGEQKVMSICVGELSFSSTKLNLLIKSASSLPLLFIDVDPQNIC